MSGAFYGREPHDAYAWMRANAPVYYDQANDLWAAASYAAVKQASVDTESFSNAQGIRPKFGPLPMMIEFDGPEHVRRRRLVSEGFTPRRVRDQEGKLRLICDALIDRVCERGSCDFVKDLAAPLPIIVIGDMLGVAPEDRDDLLRWSDDMLKALGAPDPTLMDKSAAAFVEYTDYIHPVFEDRRATKNADDLVGVLVHAEIDGNSLDDDSLVHETLLILIGGDETTRHVISGGVEELLAHPDQVAQLAADPDGLMTGAVEEMLRWVSPIKNMARTATRDVELAGEQIRAGQEILLLYPSANRDETVFENADVFDITRSPNPHMAFGFGAHFCLGNQLARLELRVMVERVLARLPDLRLATERAALPRRAANFISGIEEMPVVFTPQLPNGGRSRLMAGDSGRRGVAGWSILVTGGGSGIGLATAERLAADGAHVTICGRTEQKLVDACARISAVAADDVTARYVVADVTDEEQVAAAVAASAEATGRIDGLFACAGGSLHIGPVLTADVAAVRATIDLNLMGSIICIKQGGAAMQEQGGSGSIVLMSSGAGRFPHPYLWAYGVSKAGICFLAETAAEELGALGIRVNAVAPGIIDDELMSFITAGGPLLDDYLAQMPLGRVGTVDDVAAAVRYLLGPESSFVTGETLGIDGGHHLRRGADYSLLFG